MKLLLMSFLVMSNYLPIPSLNGASKAYTSLNGVYIDKGDNYIDLSFLSYTRNGDNDVVMYVKVESESKVINYTNNYYDLNDEEILPLKIEVVGDYINVNVLISNFFYPKEIIEYDFVISDDEIGYFDEDKKWYIDNPYFYSFGEESYLYHHLYLPYYKKEEYIDSGVNVLNYFRFNMDDLLDININLIINDSEQIELKKVYRNGLYHLITNREYYYNSITSKIEESKNDKNFKPKRCLYFSSSN